MFGPLLERIAIALDGAGIPYMIIGGQAVLLYGEPRLTKDIDITIGAGPDRLPEVLNLVRGLDLKPLVDPEVFTRQTMVLPCADRETGIRVDLILSITPYEQQAMGRVRRVKIGKAEVRFASLEDLVIHKVVAGRPRDLEDIKGALLKNPGVDVGYLKRWLGEFAAATGEPLVERLNQVLEAIG